MNNISDTASISNLRPPREPSRIDATPDAYRPVIDVEAEESIDISAYWRLLKRHKWGILGVTLVGLLIGILKALTATPIYQAETKLVAEPFQRKITIENEYINSAAVFLFYDTQFEIIRSRWVAERVVDKLNLVTKTQKEEKKTEASIENLDDTSITKRLGLIASDLLDWRKWFGIENAEENEPLSDTELREQLASNVQANINVTGGKNSQVIRIDYSDPDPRNAAQIANAVADAYIQYDKTTRKDTSIKTESWLTEQLAEAKRNLKASETQLQKYQKRTGLVATTDTQALINKRLAEIEKALVQAKTVRSDAQVKYNQAKRLIGIASGALVTVPDVLANPTVLELAKEERSLSRKVRILSERLSDTHPDMINARTELKVTHDNLQNEIQRIVADLKDSKESASARVKNLQRLLKEEKTKIGEMTGGALELARLEREVESNQKLYDALLTRFQETGATEKYDASNIRILDRAKPPETPSKPNKKRIVMIAGVLGLFFGILLAFLREQLDRTFKTTDDIEDKLGQATMGMVPLLSPKESEIPEIEYLHNPRSPFAEKINHIRTGLLFSNIDQPPRRILVTSSSASEGKTTLASNLAVAFSQLGKTLLIEVDLRKPSLAKRLNLASEQGLTELLMKPDVADEAIQPFGNSGKLFILPCGAKPPNPLELLSSKQFQNLLTKLSEHFEYIILDAPPLLAVSDAAVLGHYTDARLLVVRAEKTLIKMAEDAIDLLRKSNVPPTGIVLSMADIKRMAYYGGHYYRYDAGYYGSNEDEAQTQILG